MSGRRKRLGAPSSNESKSRGTVLVQPSSRRAYRVIEYQLNGAMILWWPRRTLRCGALSRFGMRCGALCCFGMRCGGTRCGRRNCTQCSCAIITQLTLIGAYYVSYLESTRTLTSYDNMMVISIGALLSLAPQ